MTNRVHIQSLGAARAEFITHGSVRLLCAILASAFIVRFGLGAYEPWGQADTLLLLGVMLYWPLQEWWMHRWLLHLRPFTIAGKRIEFDFARLHRLHHEQPHDIDLAFLDLKTIVGSAIVFTCVGWLLSGSVLGAASFMIGATTSTLAYEWTHFLTHTDYRPRSAYFRRVKNLHQWHHFKHEGYWYSFTLPWVDGWFGTGPHPREVQRSPFVKNLHGLSKPD